MDTLLKICLFAILAWLIFGLVNPKKALGFMKNDNSKKRWIVILLAFVAVIGCSMLFAVLDSIVSPPKAQSNAQSSSFVDSTKESKIEVDSVKLLNERIKETLRKEDSIKVVKLKPFFDEIKDDFDANGGYWIEPKNRPKYTNRNGVYSYFYMNKNGKPSNLRFRFQYYANDWLFIQSLQIKANETVIGYRPQKVESDNGDGMIWEWFDEGIKQNLAASGVLFNIASAKIVKIRIVGLHYHKDISLSDKQIKSIKNTVEYYRALGGEL